MSSLFKEKPFDATEILHGLREFITLAAASYGTTEAVRPPHRVKFHWPPHPISYEYHVLGSDWSGETSFVAHGETFPVRLVVHGHHPTVSHRHHGRARMTGEIDAFMLASAIRATGAG